MTVSSACLFSTIGAVFAVSEPSEKTNGSVQPKAAKSLVLPEKWTKRLAPAFILDARNICGVNVNYAEVYQRANLGKSIDMNKRYLVYESRDTLRQKPFTVLEVKEGRATFVLPKPSSLKALEERLGNSTENAYTIGSDSAIEQDCRVFNLIASDESNVDNVKTFAIYVKVQDGVPSNYIVDGPGIVSIEPKEFSQ